MTFYSVACTVSVGTWIFAFYFKMDNKVKRKVQTSINCCYKRKVKIHIAFTKLFILLSMIACQSGWPPTWIIMGFRARFVSSTSRKNYSFQLNNVMYMTRFIPPVIIRLKILFVFSKNNVRFCSSVWLLHCFTKKLSCLLNLCCITL